MKNLHVNENSFSDERLCTKPRFKKEGQDNSEMTYYVHLAKPKTELHIFFLWYLLISENTLTEVVKKYTNKQLAKLFPLSGNRTPDHCLRRKARRPLGQLVLILILIQLFIDCSSINMNKRVFFLGTCVRTAAKTMVLDRKKKQNTLALLHLGSGPLPNATTSSDVPTEFAADHNKDEVLEGKFRNLNFSPSTKKKTEYCFIYRN